MIAVALRVASCSPLLDPAHCKLQVVVKTLLGEYVERGINHERKFFQKLPSEGSSADPCVCMSIHGQVVKPLYA